MKYRLILTLILLFTFNKFAQSEYEIVQNFKSRISALENKIKEATLLEELQNISIEVEKLSQEFIIYKDLLDRSLYPENYQKIIENLNSAIIVRKGDFVQIEELQTEVITLRTEIEQLNKKNSELLNEIYLLEIQKVKDAQTIVKLKNLVNQLRASLAQRDELVFAIIDSLLPQIDVDTKTLTDIEKESLIAETENKNVLYLIKKTIRDNNRFLELTALKPEDLEDIKNHQDNFVSLWQKVGPKLVDIYASKPQKSNELRQIDILFTNWKINLRNEIWNSIREEFAIGGINLKKFNNSDDFTSVIINFIDEELKNSQIKGKTEAERIFSVFTDSIWYKSINPIWMPYLLDNKILSNEQKNIIEQKISEWKNSVHPAEYTWIYITVAIILISIIIIISLKLSKKKDKLEV